MVKACTFPAARSGESGNNFTTIYSEALPCGARLHSIHAIHTRDVWHGFGKVLGILGQDCEILVLVLAWGDGLINTFEVGTLGDTS